MGRRGTSTAHAGRGDHVSDDRGGFAKQRSILHSEGRPAFEYLRKFSLCVLRLISDSSAPPIDAANWGEHVRRSAKSGTLPELRSNHSWSRAAGGRFGARPMLPPSRSSRIRSSSGSSPSSRGPPRSRTTSGLTLTASSAALADDGAAGAGGARRRQGEGRGGPRSRACPRR